MKIKICGITRVTDGRRAAALGADYLGFVFCPASPRYMPPETARALIAQLPPETGKVGVFVNEDCGRVAEIADYCGLDRVQLHGDEPVTDMQRLSAYAPIKAVRPRAADDLRDLAVYAEFTLLVDTPCREYGGSGVTGDWTLARACAARHETFLAGGLSPDNVADAIRAVRPAAVDVSTGVEARKGVKDHALLARFMAAVRGAS